MESDPLSNLTHILTQIREGEEGGIQIVIKNSSDSWKIRGKQILNEISKGKSFGEALSSTNFFSMFGGGDKDKIQNMQMVNYIVLKSMESKLSKNNLKLILEFLFQPKIKILQNMNSVKLPVFLINLLLLI